MRRIVLLGRIYPEWPTIRYTPDNHPAHMVEAAGLPAWDPRPTPGTHVDGDAIRKHTLELNDNI